MPGNEQDIFVVIFKNKEGKEAALNHYLSNNNLNSGLKIARDI